MSAKVKVGYLLPTRERIMGGVHETRPILDLARKAEALGYDSLWIGDSVTAKPRHDALSMLAAIAAVTERATLGTAVLLPMLASTLADPAALHPDEVLVTGRAGTVVVMNAAVVDRDHGQQSGGTMHADILVEPPP